ncbi:ABC transporter permease [Proteocatella sphenisci]|uniref:ABC transporter permease n=1 Tax=Proteocatella sphenisci TaxID=181070 RepID=UPI000561A6DD|nr:iron ABC transporter permease [Proteocatella sphenisci]
MKIHKILDRFLLFAVVLSICIFVLYPIFSVFRMSLFDNGEFTLKYYHDILSKKNLILIRNSMWVTVLSSSLTTFFSFIIALYVFVSRPRVRYFMRSALMLTMISPPFVSALALIMLFGRRGLITYGILGLSVNPYGWQGIVILQTISGISFAALMLSGTLQNIDIRQIMASRDLGASPLQTLRNIVIPAAWPGILSVFFILFTMNLADFGTPIIIGGRYKVLATEAYLQMLSSSSLGKPAAISMLMIPPAIAAFYFYRKNISKAGNSSDGSKLSSSEDYAYELPGYIKNVLLAVVVVFFAIMILKYSNIFLSTVSNTATGKLRFTSKYIMDLPKGKIESFWRSIIYSATAGAIASFVGVLLSYYTHRRGLKGMKIVEFAASLPYIIPGTFFGLGYVAAFSSQPLLLRGTAWIIIFNFAFRQISVSNKSANAEFDTIDRKIELAARDLGASNLQVLFGIIIPMLRSTFLTCFITTFTASMTAVGAVVFLISPGTNVASVEMFQSIENGLYGVGSVQAVMIIAVTVTVNLIAMFLLDGKRGREKKIKET